MAKDKTKKEVNISEFIEMEDQLFDAIDDSRYRPVIKDGNIYLPDPNGFPCEIISVDPAEPKDMDEPAVLNLDKASSEHSRHQPHFFQSSDVPWKPRRSTAVNDHTKATIHPKHVQPSRRVRTEIAAVFWWPLIPATNAGRK